MNADADVNQLPKIFALADGVEAQPAHCRWHFRKGGSKWEVDPDGCPAHLPQDGAAAHEVRRPPARTHARPPAPTPAPARLRRRAAASRA